MCVFFGSFAGVGVRRWLGCNILAGNVRFRMWIGVLRVVVSVVVGLFAWNIGWAFVS